MVVMPEGTPQLETAQALYMRVADMGAAVDILVATPGQLERHADTVGLIYREIAREGRTIYAAQ
jgi:hypothetical protein